MVSDMSGLCRFPTRDGQSHHLCSGAWDTPSATVTCSCMCHAAERSPRDRLGNVVVKKMVKSTAVVKKKLPIDR